MNVNFRLGRMMGRDVSIVACAMLLGAGCASSSEGDSNGAAQNDELQGSADHTAGSQIRLHEGTEGSNAIEPLVTQTPGCDVSSYQGNVNWRRHPDSNWGVEDLQSSALPLGYATQNLQL